MWEIILAMQHKDAQTKDFSSAPSITPISSLWKDGIQLQANPETLEQRKRQIKTAWKALRCRKSAEWRVWLTVMMRIIIANNSTSVSMTHIYHEAWGRSYPSWWLQEKTNISVNLLGHRLSNTDKWKLIWFWSLTCKDLMKSCCCIHPSVLFCSV